MSFRTHSLQEPALKKKMEKLHSEWEDCDNEEKGKSILAHLKSLSNSEMKIVLTKKFRNKKNYFHFVVQSNHVEIAKVLIANGANVDDSLPETDFKLLDPVYETYDLFEFVCHCDFTEMICLFLKHGANLSIRHLSKIIEHNNIAVVQFIARNRNFQNMNGINFFPTMLWLATDIRKPEIVKTMFCHVNVNSNIDLKEFVPIFGSALYKGREVVKVLLDYGPSLSSRDVEGYTGIEYGLADRGFIVRTRKYSIRTLKLMIYKESIEKD